MPTKSKRRSPAKNRRRIPDGAPAIPQIHADATEQTIAQIEKIKPVQRTAREWTMLAQAYANAQRVDEAAAAYRAASLIDPDNPAMLSNAVQSATRQDREVEAFATLRCALRRDPTLTEAWHNLGAMARNLGHLELAVACYEMASSQWESGRSRLGAADALIQLGDATQARALAEEAVRRSEPGSTEYLESQLARGFASMLLGDLTTAWEDNDLRLTRRAYRNMTPPDLRVWSGPSDPASHLFLWREQGIGDEIRFLSTLPDLLQDVDQVTLRCTPRLARIFSRSFPVETVTGGLEVPPDADAQLAMGSMARYYRPSLGSFPTAPAYLVPDPQQVEEFQRALRGLGQAPKIGLSWRSRVLTNKRNHNYPILDDLAPLATLEGVQFIDLQYEYSAEELDYLRDELGLAIHHFEDLDLKDDLDGVLALCAALDGVVSVGNAVAELSGAVGTPTYRIGLAHGPLEFEQHTSVWHRRTTLCNKEWGDPWSVAIEPAVAALRADLA